MVWVPFAATLSEVASCELLEKAGKVCPPHLQLVSGHPEDSDSNEKRYAGGISLTCSSKCLNSCAESQMKSIPHTPVLLLLFPGIWHRNNQLGFNKHFHCDCTKNGL